MVSKSDKLQIAIAALSMLDNYALAMLAAGFVLIAISKTNVAYPTYETYGAILVFFGLLMSSYAFYKLLNLWKPKAKK